MSTVTKQGLEKTSSGISPANRLLASDSTSRHASRPKPSGSGPERQEVQRAAYVTTSARHTGGVCDWIRRMDEFNLSAYQ